MTQPCFRGYPLKIKLTRDRFHGHLHTLMLQIHGTKCAVSWWHLFFAGLGCASLSNFGSEPSWFAPHGRLVFTRQYHISHLIRKHTWAGSWRLLCESIAFIWPCDLVKTLVGCTTEWSFRLISDPFCFFAHSFSVPTSFSLLDNSDCLLGIHVELLSAWLRRHSQLQFAQRSELLGFGRSVNFLLEFFYVRDLWKIESTFSRALLGL